MSILDDFSSPAGALGHVVLLIGLAPRLTLILTLWATAYGEVLVPLGGAESAPIPSNA